MIAMTSFMEFSPWACPMCLVAGLPNDHTSSSRVPISKNPPLIEEIEVFASSGGHQGPHQRLRGTHEPASACQLGTPDDGYRRSELWQRAE
jgi:hypothetical protein